MCGAGFKSSAYWFFMKKTDFPDMCCGCRLTTREKMRAELEGRPFVSDKKPQNEFVIEIKEVKKGKVNGPKPKTAAQKKEPEKKVTRKVYYKFEDILKEGDKNFPSLPE